MFVRHAARRLVLVSGCALALATAAHAQEDGPQPVPLPPPVPAPVDTPYPGTLKLSVDATDTVRAIFRVHETVPVAAPGPLSCSFPNGCPAIIRRPARSTSSPAS